MSSIVAGRIVTATRSVLCVLAGVEEAIGVAVDEGFPRSLDDVLADPDRGPLALAVRQVDQHANRRPRADAAIEDAYSEVLELHVVELGIVVGQRLAERVVERSDRPLSLGALDVTGAARHDLDGGFGQRPLARALLDVYAIALDREVGLGPPVGATQEQVERRLREVVGVPPRLPVLQLLDRDRDRRVAQLDAELLGLHA